MNKKTLRRIISRVKGIKYKKLYLFLSIIVILLVLLNISYFAVFSKIYGGSDQVANRINLDPRFLISNQFERFYRFLEVVNVFRVKRNLMDGTLPIYNVEFSDNDINHFENLSHRYVQQGYKDDASNTWRRAKLTVGGENYDVKVKVHGDSPSHWRSEIKSYSIKGDPDYVNGLKRFNLILLEDRLLRGRTASLLSQYFDLLNIRDDFVVLRINGVTQGMYYLQEFLGNDFLENNQCSSCVVMQRSDEYLIDHARYNYHGLYLNDAGHITPLDYEISSIDTPRTNLNPDQVSQVFFRLHNLFQAIEGEKVQELPQFFDFDYLTSFEAMRRIMGYSHDIEGDNLKLIYSASTGKFYIAPFNEEIRRITLKHGSLEHFINQKIDSYVPLFFLLSKNDRFRYEVQKKLYRFIVEEHEGFLADLAEENDKYIPYATSFPMAKRSPKYAQFLMEYEKDTIKHNLDLWKKNLEYAKMYLNVIQYPKKIRIEIIPDSMTPLQFNKLNLSLATDYFGDVLVTLNDDKETVLEKSLPVEGRTIDLASTLREEYFSAGLDDNLFSKKRRYIVEVSFKKDIKLADFKADSSNKVTGARIAENDVYINIADGRRAIPSSTVDNFLLQGTSLNWKNEQGNLILLKGNYLLREDLVVPPGKRFSIEAGTSLTLAKGVSVVSYRPLFVQGTKEDPVYVTSRGGSFGTFAVVGPVDCQSSINYLDLSGGSEDFLEGIYFSGALSIHGCDLEMKNSYIHDNKADDGLNVKYGKVFFDQNRFKNNAADQVDLDFTEGTVTNSHFSVDQTLNSNGDGLDLSGSQLTVNNNFFAGFPDKGISIGEKTQAVVRHNQLVNNNVSVAVKDASMAYLVGNTFEDNQIFLSVYQKKQLFGGALAILQHNQVEGSSQIFPDKFSSVRRIEPLPTSQKLISQLVDQGKFNLLFPFLEKQPQN